MLIIRKSQTNNLIATVSMNKTLSNPYYLFSFQHIASKERISFYPQVITSNVRYDKFRFVEAPTTNLSVTPPQVYFEYLGQYYYSIYENITSGSTDIALAYNKLESGRAWVIVGDDNTQECFFEPYISNDENFSQIIYVSEEEENCIYPTPSITSTNTPTPSITPTLTPSATCPITTQYLEVELSENTKFKLILWNQPNYTSPANALCDYNISGCAYGDLGTVFCGIETILQGEHQHQFNLSSVLLPGEIVTGFTVNSYSATTCVCPVNLVFPSQPTPTPTVTPTITPTPSLTPSVFTGLTLTVASGATANAACTALGNGQTFTVYTNDLGNCGGCYSAGFTCWPCLNTTQTLYLDQAFTIPVQTGYYANEFGTGQVATWYTVNGQLQGGGFGGC